jgi:hypothetical protein
MMSQAIPSFDLGIAEHDSDVAPVRKRSCQRSDGPGRKYPDAGRKPATSRVRSRTARARTYANQSALNSGFPDPRVYSCNAACSHAPSLPHCVAVPEGGADMAIDSVEMAINSLGDNVVDSVDVGYSKLSNAPLITNFDPVNSALDEPTVAMVVSGAIDEPSSAMVVSGAIDEPGGAMVVSGTIDEQPSDVITNLEHSTPINQVLSSHPAATGFLPDSIDDEPETNASIANERWLRNRFREWCEIVNIQPFHHNLEDYEWEVLGPDLFPRFFRCLLKKDGERFPSQSLKNLLNSIQRILRRKQRARMIETKIYEPLFVIRQHTLFALTCDACLKSMEKSVKEGANLQRRKVDIFTLEHEHLILSHPQHQITDPYGLLMRWVWYCCSEFSIRGANELQKLELRNFSIVEYNGSPCVRYNLFILHGTVVLTSWFVFFCFRNEN